MIITIIIIYLFETFFFNYIIYFKTFNKSPLILDYNYYLTNNHKLYVYMIVILTYNIY